VETHPVPDVLHLGAVPPELVADVALTTWPAGAVLAATPLGAGKAQLVLISFAGDGDLGKVNALATTHHGKDPHRPAVAAAAAGTFVVWDEGGALVATHFDAAGKEGAETCTVSPAGPGKYQRLAVAATRAGAIVSWMEGTHVRTRALDPSGCPASPIWTVGEGRWASLAATADSAVVAWVADDGRLVAARLSANGAPAAAGINASEGSTGVKDPPGLVAFGQGKLAFAWAETMSATVTTKRLVMRTLEAACVP
jgi:hypothetical protein